MMTLRNIACLALAASLLSACSGLQTTTVTVESGTQFAVAGNRDALYLDLQGLLWKRQPDSGTAVPLSTAQDDLRRPQLSPDGTRLVMQSFGRGHWDIRMCDGDGSNVRLLTETPFDDREPVWTADGKHILFTSDRSGNDDIWSVDIVTGELRQLTDHPANDYAPGALNNGFAFISDRNRTPELYLQENGQLRLLAKAPAGRLYPPRVSPDGKQIAWVQATERNGFPGVARNALVHADINSGISQQLSAADSDVFAQPPVWLDNSTLMYTTDGVIRRHTINGTADGQNETTLPFSADLALTIDRYTQKTPLAFSQAQQTMRGIVDPVMLPGNHIVFTALGDLWQLHNDGTLTQLTNDAFVERDLSVSADGKQLAYISDRSGSMQIWLRDLATGTDTQVSTRSNGPRYPTFSPNGTRLAYQQVGPIGTQDFTVRELDLTSGKSRKLRNSPKIWPGRMAYSADGQHIIVAELHKQGRASDGRNRLMRIALDGTQTDSITLPSGTTPDTGPVSNPKGTELALVIDGKLWHLAVNPDGTAAGRPQLILDALVESPAWSPTGEQILVLGPAGLTQADTRTGQTEVRNPEHDWTPTAGKGTQLIHAGRLWDGLSNTYRSNVDVLVEGARILAVKPHAPHPNGINVIDASHQTVLPGLIDHHVHFEAHKGEWIGRALLAFGVTTVVEPGGLPYESREHFESWQSGRRPGPRLLFSGPQLDGARRTFHFASHINSEERLQRELKRADRLGYSLLKTYRRLAPTLQQRTVELGHARGLPVTAHAALRNLGFGGDRTEHLRGSSRTESASKQTDLLKSYDDIHQIDTRPGAAVVPTLINQGGYFDVALKTSPGFNNVTQYTHLYPAAYRNNLVNFSKLVERRIELVRAGLTNAGKTINMLNANGTLIVAGTDSPIFPYGLSLVIELQNYADAGLTPADALRTATSNAARAMGADHQVGSIVPGLLADLMIVSGDPLSNISDLTHVTGVMLNGRYRTLEALLNPPAD